MLAGSTVIRLREGYERPFRRALRLMAGRLPYTPAAIREIQYRGSSSGHGDGLDGDRARRSAYVPSLGTWNRVRSNAPGWRSAGEADPAAFPSVNPMDRSPGRCRTARRPGPGSPKPARAPGPPGGKAGHGPEQGRRVAGIAAGDVGLGAFPGQVGPQVPGAGRRPRGGHGGVRRSGSTGFGSRGGSWEHCQGG
jgi:hypothetical protein